MAPISFKDMISVDYRPGEPEEIKYYAHKRRKQYHGNESKDIDELSMKRDRKLPNLKIPVKGKKGVSKFMRKKAIGQAKDDLNASVQSADRKPEKYIKPDGKVGIRMVKTDKEVIKKEAIKHTHAVVDPAGKVAGMTSNERDAKDIARRHKGRVIKLKKPMSPNKGDMMINRPFKESISRDQMMRMHQQAAASQKKNQAKRDEKEKKSMAAKADMDMKAQKEEVDEALTLQQRMKRSRLMKRLKTRIKIGRDRARRKMANKKTLEKRAMRQARAAIAKKLTRGIPKAELTFARKQEIEKRLDKPALKSRIKRIAKRIFKDVRKKEVQRKKG